MLKTTKMPKTLLIVIAILAIVASACAGSNAESVQTGGVAASAKTSSSTPAETSTSTSTAAPDVSAASALAYAIDKTEGLSFSFEQGYTMEMQMGGMSMVVAPEAPLTIGEVQGDWVHMVTDIGEILAETFRSVGLDADDPTLDDASFEIWLRETDIVVDFSGFATTMSSLDPATGATFGKLAEGPVRIDLGAVEGIQPGDLAAIFGDSGQSADPRGFVRALRELDLVSQQRSDVVDGRPVIVYDGTIAMDDFYAALGMDLEEQTQILEQFGVSTDSPESAIVDAVLEGIASVVVETTVMVDEQGLVRRVESSIDIGAMLTAVFDDPAVRSSLATSAGVSIEEFDQSTGFFLRDMEMRVGYWQEYDQYGQVFPFDPPSTDVALGFDEVLAILAAG